MKHHRQLRQLAVTRSSFQRLARASARTTGHPWAFGSSFAMIVVWLLTGPVFQYLDTWQLVINTTTSVATFVMVFLIQNTQNHHIKTDYERLDRERSMPADEHQN